MTTETLEKHPYEIERDKPMPSKLHARVQGRIAGIFYSLYAKKYEVLPELNVLFNDTIYVPDLCIYKVGELNETEDEINVTTPPITAIEILSPSQGPQSLLDKAKVYFEQGVQSYWLAMPAFENIYVYQQNLKTYEIYKKEDTLKDGVLGVKIDLGKVF